MEYLEIDKIHVFTAGDKDYLLIYRLDKRTVDIRGPLPKVVDNQPLHYVRSFKADSEGFAMAEAKRLMTGAPASP